MTISKAIKAPIEVSTETIFPSSVQTNRNVDNSSSIPVALFSSEANTINNIHAISSSSNTLSANHATINAINEETATLSTNNPNLISSLKEINSNPTQLSNLNSNSYTQNNNIALLTTSKNKNNVTTNLNLNNVESNVIDANNINTSIQNSLLSSVQTITPQTLDIEVLDLHQSSKWKDSEVRKILIYLSDTKNFQKYCKEKKTKTYNILSELLTTKTSSQIKNKLSSLESTYRRIKTKYQDFLQSFNPKDSEQVKLCKENVLKEFPFFFEMDEIFHAKLQSGKLESEHSSSSINKISNGHLICSKETDLYDLDPGSLTNFLTPFFDIEAIQKVIKKIHNENKINEELPSSSENSEQIKENVNIEEASPKMLSNSELENNASVINSSFKNNKKRKLNDADIQEITNSTKEIINIFRESEEKRLKLQKEYDDKRLLLKKLLAEKEWENRRALEEKKLEIQKQYNNDMKVLRERELDLEESKQKLEREKLELEKVQINLQIKLYEEKLINHYQNNDINRGLSSISSTLATLNNINNLNSVQVLQNNNNSQKK